MKVLYWGLFFENGALEDIVDEELEKHIENKHVTYEFSPKEDDIPWEIFGKPGFVFITGYGINEKNEGVSVELLDHSELYRGADVPHITISTALDGKAKDTARLPFREGDKLTGKIIEGRFGAMVAGRRLPVFSSHCA